VTWAGVAVTRSSRGAGSRSWRVGLPFLAGAAILLVLALGTGRAGWAVAAAGVGCWGALWVWGAARAARGAARKAAAPEYVAPGLGEAVVLGRARRGLRRGVLCASQEALLWVPGAAADVARPGRRVALGGLEATGHAPRVLAAFADLVSYRSLAGVYGEGTLTLELRDGTTVVLRPRDPELLVLLGGAFSASDDGHDE